MQKKYALLLLLLALIIPAGAGAATLKQVPSLTSESWGTIKNVLNYNLAELDVRTKVVEVDGSKKCTLTLAQMSNISIVHNTGQTMEDIAVELPSPDSVGYAAEFHVGTSQSNKWGVQSGINDEIYIIEANGTLSKGMKGGFAGMQEAQVGQEFLCWSFRTGSVTFAWKCKAVATGTSTFSAQ